MLYPFGLTHFHSILMIGILRGWAIIPVANIWIAIVSFILTCGLTYLLFRRSMKILSSLAQEEVHVSKHQDPKEIAINLEFNTPIKAIYKKDMAYIFRNFSSTLYFIFPILMPLILLIQIFAADSVGYDAFFEITLFTFFYSGMTLSFAIMCITAPESNTGGLLYILPSKMKDIYRVKRRIMYISMFLSAIAPSIIMIAYAISNKFEIPENTILQAIFMVLSYLLIYFYGTELALTLYSRFFGKMRNKYTILMLNVKHKFLKIGLGIAILYVGSYIPLVAGYFLGILLGYSVFYGSTIMLGTSILLFGVIRWIAYKNFNFY